MSTDNGHLAFREQIDAYVTGGLSAVERAALEAHVADCPVCAADSRAAADADAGLNDLFSPIRPGPDFEDRMAGRWRAASAPERRLTIHPLVRRAAVGAAAAIVLGGFGYVVNDTISRSGGLPVPWALGPSRGAGGATGGSGGAAGRLANYFSEQAPAEGRNGRGLSLWQWQKGDAKGESASGPKDERDKFLLPTDDANGVGSAPQSPAEMAKAFNESVNGTTAWGEAFAAKREPSAVPAAASDESKALAIDVRLKDALVLEPYKEGGAQLKNAKPGSATTVSSGGAVQPPGGATVQNKREQLEILAQIEEERLPDLKLYKEQVQAGEQRQAGQKPGQQSNQTGMAQGLDANGRGAAFGDLQGIQSPPIAEFYSYRSEPTADRKDRLSRAAAGDKPGAGGESGGGFARGFKPGEQFGWAMKPGAVDAVGKKVAEAAKPNFTDAPDFFASKAQGQAAQGPGSGGPAVPSDGTPDTGEMAEEAEKLNEQVAKADAKNRDRTNQLSAEARDEREMREVAQGSDDEKAGPESAAAAPADSTEPPEAAAPEAPKIPGGDPGQPVPATAAPEAAAAPAPGDPALADPPRAPAPTPVPTTPAPAPATPPAAQVAPRKIIRNGEMTFEVDGFDSAFLQISKIAGEEGGFVATTDSEKLPNGKVKGSVIVRVPPERLDTLVLKLRGLGDLKSSRIAAQDITKQYTDIESQLRAAAAMQERLLLIIKNGKGAIKDLLEAEKQLGVWREKIERLEGEIRYYNNLVSLSTLTIGLFERDIRQAALLSETEHVNMGVEAIDVEKARNEAIQAIDEAKGRIIESDLKKLEAGQLAARIVADVAPDKAGPLIDRMKQIGVVARLEIERKQTTAEGTAPPMPGVKVERRDTRFLISLYNLANVAPRQTTSLNLAADDVEKAFRSVVDQVKGAGGRVVTSQLNRPKPDQTTGTITFEMPAEGAEVLLGAVRATGEVMRLDVTQNPDTQNTTDTKRGFSVQIFSLATVAPRETTSLRVAARDVPAAFNKLRDAVRTAQGRVITSQLSEQDPASVSGQLDFEIRREEWPAFEAALPELGQTLSRSVTRSADTENTVDSKLRVQVNLLDEAALNPRETVTMQLAVTDVPARYAALLEALRIAGARVLQSQLNEGDRNNVTGTLVFDLRRTDRAGIDKALTEAGDVFARSVSRSSDTQNTLDDRVRLSLTLTDAERLPPRELTTLGMEAADIEKAKENIESLALGLGGRVVESTLSRETNGRVMAKVVVDVPLDKAMEAVTRTRDQGRVQFRRDSREEQVPAGKLARARLDVTLANSELIVASNEGLAATIRSGLATSVRGLLWSLQLIVVGLCLVAPWALILWLVWRVARRNRRAAPTKTVTPSTPASPPPPSTPTPTPV